MNFEELNDTIPYCKGGKVKVLRYSPYPNVTIAMPGRHAEQTVPKGGDFVVMVKDPALTYNGRDPEGEHQFKHKDIFYDIEAKRKACTNAPRLMDLKGFMACYYDVVKRGYEPESLAQVDWMAHTIDPTTFLQAVQCLAVAEHRRYAQHELKYGGRYLPFRFAAGISEGLWTAEDAIMVERKGRPGAEYLEKEHGVPELTKELMK